jgi:DNA repair protein RecO
VADFIQTEGLVLRQTPYSETSLIVVLLTADHGQVHVMLKGARRSGRRSFPAVDLFRCVRVIYRPSRSGDLHTAREAELVTAHDSIASRRRAYAAAGWLARTTLQNTIDGQPAPRVYDALLRAFGRLADPATSTVEPVALAVGFVILAEHGLLPDLSADPAREAQMAAVLAYAAAADAPCPDFPADTWLRLLAWLGTHLDRAGMKPPPPWPSA